MTGERDDGGGGRDRTWAFQSLNSWAVFIEESQSGSDVSLSRAASIHDYADGTRLLRLYARLFPDRAQPTLSHKKPKYRSQCIDNASQFVTLVNQLFTVSPLGSLAATDLTDGQTSDAVELALWALAQASTIDPLMAHLRSSNQSTASNELSSASASPTATAKGSSPGSFARRAARPASVAGRLRFSATASSDGGLNRSASQRSLELKLTLFEWCRANLPSFGKDEILKLSSIAALFGNPLLLVSVLEGHVQSSGREFSLSHLTVPDEAASRQQALGEIFEYLEHAWGVPNIIDPAVPFVVPHPDERPLLLYLCLAIAALEGRPLRPPRRKKSLAALFTSGSGSAIAIVPPSCPPTPPLPAVVAVAPPAADHLHTDASADAGEHRESPRRQREASGRKTRLSYLSDLSTSPRPRRSSSPPLPDFLVPSLEKITWLSQVSSLVDSDGTASASSRADPLIELTGDTTVVTWAELKDRLDMSTTRSFDSVVNNQSSNVQSLASSSSKQTSSKQTSSKQTSSKQTSSKQTTHVDHTLAQQTACTHLLELLAASQRSNDDRVQTELAQLAGHINELRRQSDSTFEEIDWSSIVANSAQFFDCARRLAASSRASAQLQAAIDCAVSLTRATRADYWLLSNELVASMERSLAELSDQTSHPGQNEIQSRIRSAVQSTHLLEILVSVPPQDFDEVGLRNLLHELRDQLSACLST